MIPSLLFSLYIKKKHRDAYLYLFPDYIPIIKVDDEKEKIHAQFSQPHKEFLLLASEIQRDGKVLMSVQIEI